MAKLAGKLLYSSEEWTTDNNGNFINAVKGVPIHLAKGSNDGLIQLGNGVVMDDHVINRDDLPINPKVQMNDKDFNGILNTELNKEMEKQGLPVCFNEEGELVDKATGKIFKGGETLLARRIDGKTVKDVLTNGIAKKFGEEIAKGVIDSQFSKDSLYWEKQEAKLMQKFQDANWGSGYININGKTYRVMFGQDNPLRKMLETPTGLVIKERFAGVEKGVNAGTYEAVIQKCVPQYYEDSDEIARYLPQSGQILKIYTSRFEPQKWIDSQKGKDVDWEKGLKYGSKGDYSQETISVDSRNFEPLYKPSYNKYGELESRTKWIENKQIKEEREKNARKVKSKIKSRKDGGPDPGFED